MGRVKSGKDNHCWKGDAAGYKALHRRVSKARGQPSRCEVCGTESLDVGYDWANLTGNYADVNDYIRACKSCHSKIDDHGRNLPKKLDHTKAHQILELKGKLNQRQIGEKFGVTQATVSRIHAGKIWR